MKKILFRALIFSILLSNAIAAQETKNIFGSILWLKNDTQEKSNSDVNPENLKLNQLNFNYVIDFKKNNIPKIYDDLVNNKSSLFIVFRNSLKNENTLVIIKKGKSVIKVSNKKIVSGNDIMINEDSKNGLILSYLSNQTSVFKRKKGKFEFDELLYDEKEFKNQILELIYIPELVGMRQKEKIETYLSLKYGISLSKEKNYYDSQDTVLWDAKENKDYSVRVTAIAKDSFFDLNQKQSGNSKNDGLNIGLNKIATTNFENKTVLDDNTFIIWGDNGKSATLENDKNKKLKKMERVWRLATKAKTQTTYNTQIKIDKTLMKVENNYKASDKVFTWLAIDTTANSEFSYANAKFIKASSEDEKEVIFDNVTWDSNKQYFFSLVKDAEKNDTSKNEETTQKSETIIPSNNVNILSDTGYTLYPNPVKANELFSLQFNLEKIAAITIQLFDVNGKLLKNKNLGTIASFLFQDSLPTPGTYLLRITIDGDAETHKLIVR